jgi:hypothetical protein
VCVCVCVCACLCVNVVARCYFVLLPNRLYQPEELSLDESAATACSALNSCVKHTTTHAESSFAAGHPSTLFN